MMSNPSKAQVIEALQRVFADAKEPALMPNPKPEHRPEPIALRVGDIIPYWDERFGYHRFYRVEACYYGATGHQSVIELRSLTEKMGLVEGVEVLTTMVPEPLLRGREVWRKVEPV
jgi:hypothetical protein